VSRRNALEMSAIQTSELGSMIMSMQRELTLLFSELSHIGVACPRCGTEIVTDATSPVADSFPDACPCCKEPFGTFLALDIKKFRDAFRLLTTRENVPRAFVRVRCSGNTAPKE
jgi:hypothetical protein